MSDKATTFKRTCLPLKIRVAIGIRNTIHNIKNIA